ncbi:disulfide bond formation protein B [Shewanella sp. MBTL60-007]|uniref:disulfide bond formation protein B n=1 Tax=Shewanella sp. MBTL60-007 TaxID=2815911 RepID=UPI001BC076AD|nr:disulfide bond formation protein B [Shewanella sp. MBTL60-007]GIU19181.1 disulfide bond formation protein B [Shewanella sp. MBTL60-007]
MMNELTVNRIVSLAALALITLPVGIACIILGFAMGDTPCILCWQERTAMVLVSLIAIFIMRYGLKPKYIGALIITAVYGLWAGYRHSSAHILRDIGQGFGPAIFGVHTYVWVIVVFAIILLFAGVLMLLQGDKLVEKSDSSEWSLLNKVTVNVFLVIIGFNIVQAFTQTGPFPYIGQSDPVRMTFDSEKTIWSTANWPAFSKLSARGAYSIEKPDFAAMTANAATKVATNEALSLLQSVDLPADIFGLATGISYNPQSKLYAVVTSNNWVYFLDDTLTTTLAKVQIDAAFSAEISNLAGVTFDGETSVLVTADHKSFVRVEYDSSVKFDDTYGRFIEGTDGVREVKRSRFATVRAKYNYVASVAWDANTQEYLMVTLPATKRNNFVVSRLSGKDYELNSEAIISIDAKAYPNVTGVSVVDDKAYLLSHSGQQMLTMDLASNTIVAASDIAGLNNPQALTVVNGEFAVLDASEGNNRVNFYQIQK